MKKLWEKKNTIQNNLIDSYCFLEGVELDNNLIEEDVYGSIAHAQMLSSIGILTKKEFILLKKYFVEIISLHKKGLFKIESGDEDVHTKVENYLVSKLGDIGKKIHTARSRNDQVLVDLRLYAKKKIFEVSSNLLKTTLTFTEFAKKYEFVPMPGYTHMQKAMPSSLGMWSSSFAESLFDDLFMFENTYVLNNQSPLGSGAAYGVSLPIDRELTSRLLGFSNVQNNSLYCQVSRPKIQLSLMQALVQIMLTLSRFAQDVLLFTTSEYDFFSIDESLCTGSSIMPQKKNVDILEYVRAKTHQIVGYEQIVSSIAAGLPSGYNADFGQTKAPFMESFKIVSQTLLVINTVLLSLTPNQEVLLKACSPELYATNAVYELVKKKVPFRDAYKTIGNTLDHFPSYDPVKVIRESKHIGATGNLNLNNFERLINLKKQWWTREYKTFSKVINSLIQL